jgi:uncharacterized membrane-anchored protein YhcB (DUF1043 family)
MDLGSIIALVGLIITIFVGITGYIRLSEKHTERIRVLEERMREDREKNEKQHEEFYCNGKETSKEVTMVAGDVKGIGDRLKAVEDGIKEMLSLLRVSALRRDTDV